MKEAQEPPNGYWQAVMWDIAKKMKTQQGYTSPSWSFLWCDVMWCDVMLKNIRQLSLQWTRYVLLFFFNSVNSHTQCLNPYKFLASTLFSTKNIHRMKKLFIYYLLFGCSSVYSYTFSSRHKLIHASLHKSLTSHIGWKAVIYSVVPSTVWNF